MKKSILYVFVVAAVMLQSKITAQNLKLHPKGYFTARGLDVTVFDDIYPDGHQTGVTVIQHGERVMANGDLRLEISPGQWSPVPKEVEKKIDAATQTISQWLAYPDESKNRKGFNPIVYPDLQLKYNVNVTPAQGNSFRITVDLENEVDADWLGKIGFNIELFPGDLFGKSYICDGKFGIFTHSPYGPLQAQIDGQYLGKPLCKGKRMTIAPESDLSRITVESNLEEISLFDGRISHNNGWFILRTPIAKNSGKRVVDIVVSPNVIPNWTYKPVVQVSQVGYYPAQAKVAILETDPNDSDLSDVILLKHDESGKKTVKSIKPKRWGDFLRYNYYQLDFSEIKEEGVYTLSYRGNETSPFQISKTLFDRNVWQPILEYFLPVQMCHVRVNEKYRIWHDFCHLDDAQMAPTNINHFDGYVQGPSTLTKFKPHDIVPGLNQGGWHDAGDDDLRVESQIGTIWNLALMLEEFNIESYDATTVDLEKKIVEIHQPDGKSDAIQQMEHGLSSVLAGYRSLGRLYRGIITNSLKQYVILGDFGGVTDGVWSANPSAADDDRWVFTEDNPDRELNTAAGLAASYRALKNHNPKLAEECLETAKALYKTSFERARRSGSKVELLVELALATKEAAYINQIVALQDDILKNFRGLGWRVGRVKHLIKDKGFLSKLNVEAQKWSAATKSNSLTDSPYGVPYTPNIWGAGWTLQDFGVEQYYFSKSWPEHANYEIYSNALNFILGVHPGNNTASFASGIGSNSLLVAYGMNRADWSYIPGGVTSGTALIRPNLPELKKWPYFWQQTEYVLGGGSTDFMFLVLAVQKHFQK
jgi:endoglucanase